VLDACELATERKVQIAPRLLEGRPKLARRIGRKRRGDDAGPGGRDLRDGREELVRDILLGHGFAFRGSAEHVARHTISRPDYLNPRDFPASRAASSRLIRLAVGPRCPWYFEPRVGCP